MDLEDFEATLLESELAVILRALLQRSGGMVSITADEMPKGLYTIDVGHNEDGGIEVYLHDHGETMQ